MSDEMDRFFNLMQEQGHTLSQQGEDLAKISQSIADTHERLFGGNSPTPGAIPYLYAEVNKHSHQISLWKGGIAVLTFMWGAALAWGGVVLSKHSK